MRYLDVNSISNLSLFPEPPRRLSLCVSFITLRMHVYMRFFNQHIRKAIALKQCLREYTMTFYVPLTMDSVLYWCY